MIMRVLLLLLLFLAALTPFEGLGAAADKAKKNVCVSKGQWVSPETGGVLDGSRFLEKTARSPIVLLGESHDQADHHRWQLHTLAALKAHVPDMALGFEAFPRSLQPILDRWVEGALSEKEFLKAVDWHNTWRFDPALYMPLFHFTRLHRLPMLALNVDRKLVSSVGESGWKAIPQKDRQDIDDPAPALKPYRDVLAEIYAAHTEKKEAGKKPQDDPAFDHFVDAQLTWDRAMALILAKASKKHALVVGITGAGHLENGYGIPYQLADLGITKTPVLLPWNEDRSCQDMAVQKDGAPLAQAVFGLPPKEQRGATNKPRLGVRVSETDGGIRVEQVLENSVAEATGLSKGDVITKAAMTPVTKVSDFIAIIRKQSPGTWLPLAVERKGKTLDIVAKFPPQP
jgi:uncharacterized iron-regulated protein